MSPLEFELTNEQGETVSAADYQNRITLLFFGFTHCPDICPTTLANLASVSNELEEELEKELEKELRDDLRVLFVSVDPDRDDPETLREYTESFGPEFIGLTGEKAQLETLTRRYRVTYGYGAKDDAGNYDVSHSSAVFAFNRDGEAQLLMRESDPRDAVLADLRQLLSTQ
ncbi:redoxin domain-containing protein [Halomonas sp. ZH2S]|uniref:Redoxin domain-containing protein n=2 Tax=Vreelandella zhuhanensis TaxID=2684210 RepID=A0A7X3KP02_9GAMM|nr:redoxin domain-containing protein [Halomonas zhuhanensis]